MKGGTININNSKTGQLCGFEMKGGTININNSKTGHDCGEGMKGGTINITNSKTGQLCGFEMKDGTINITKSEIGSDCGWGMEGGTINITKSEIGDACGMRMKSGTINITKSETRSYCGFEMKDGTINITNSKTGHDCGEGIKGGTINITKSEIGSDCGMRMKSGTININNSKTGDDCGEGIKGGVILISESEITSFGITLGGCVFYEQQINEYFITNKNLKEKTKNWLIQKNGYKNFLKALKEEIQKNYSSGLLELIKHLKNKNDVYEELTKIMNPNNKEKIIKNYYNEHLRLGYKKFDYNFFKEIGLIKLDSKVIKEKISETENLEKKQKLELLDYYLISLDDKKSYLNNLYKILHAFPNNSDEYYSVNKFFKQLSNLGKDLTRFLSEEITGFWSNSLVLKNMKEIGLNEKAWINYEKINKNSERIVRKSESDLKQILKDYLTDLIPSEVLEKYSDNAGVRDEYYEIKMVFEKTNPEDFKELTTLYTAFNEFWDNHSKKILEKVEEFEKTVKEKVESVNQNLSGKQKQKKIIDLLKEIPEYEIKKQYKKIQHITQNLSIIGEELSTTTQITNTSSRVWRRNSLEDLDTRIPCACIGLRSKFGSEYHVYMWKYHSDLRFFNLDILVGEEPTWKILGFLGMENEKPVLVINSIEGDIVGFDEKLIKQVDEHLKEFMKQLKIKTAYYSTTTHNQPGNKYKEYLKTRYEKTIPTITPILNKHYKHPYFEKDKVYLDFIQTEDFGKEKIKQEFIKIEN